MAAEVYADKADCDYRTPAKVKIEIKERLPMKMPLIAYVFATSVCFAAAGESCDYLSRSLPMGNASASACGVSCAFCTLAIYAALMGIRKFIKDNKS